jgi:hypothetical protein
MPLTTEEIRRAIYLDFESEGKRRNGEQPPPILGGTSIDGVYTPTLLHSDLLHAAKARGWGHSALADYLKAICEQATAENRRIVFFSSTEFTIFKNHGLDITESGFDLRKPAKKSKLYKDVWATFKESERRFRDPQTARSTKETLRTKAHGLLTLIAADLGLPRPHAYNAGKVGAMIRYVLNQAQSKGDYESWSRGSKTKLTNLVNHNKHDCKATRFVLEHLGANA